jgi:hypothetical protein
VNGEDPLAFVRRVRNTLRGHGVRTAPVPGGSDIHLLRLFAERAYDGELWLMTEKPSSLDLLLHVERPLTGTDRLEDDPAALPKLRAFIRTALGSGKDLRDEALWIKPGPATLKISAIGAAISALDIGEVVAVVSESWRTGRLAISPPDEPAPPPAISPAVLRSRPTPVPPPPDLEARVAERLAPFSAVVGTLGGVLVARVSLDGHGARLLTGVVELGVDRTGLTGAVEVKLGWPPTGALAIRPQAGLLGHLQSFFEDALDRAGIRDEPLDAAYLFFGDLSAIDLVRARGPLLALRPADLRLTIGDGRLQAAAIVEGDEQATLDACLELLNLWSSEQTR